MHPDLRCALALADTADALTLERFRAPDLRVETKSDSTPVTEVDERVETALRERLGRERPHEKVVGEEYGGDAATGDAVWFIDPIDGTKNYARGIPVWATLIALHRNGDGVCAVVSAPALGRRWLAARGEGARDATGATLAVSCVSTLGDAFLSCTDFRDFTGEAAAAFDRLSSACRIVRGFGDFWSHILVAEGGIDIGIELGVRPWDIAAVKLIVEEAGGRCTDLRGADSIDTRSVISSNGALHDEVVRLMAGA